MNNIVPEYLYHGTVTKNIEEFEPRKRYTPGTGDVPARIYATDKPAFAAMHAFPWSSEEGIDIVEREGILFLQVPRDLKDRLNQSISIYKLKGDYFVLTEEEETGNTYHTEQSLRPEEEVQFDSVEEAVQHFGGKIEFI